MGDRVWGGSVERKSRNSISHIATDVPVIYRALKATFIARRFKMIRQWERSQKKPEITPEMVEKIA